MGAKKTADQKNGETQVQALIDALLADSNPEREPFGQVLLARFGAAARQAAADPGRLTDADLLYEILRGLLEAELESALRQLQRSGINRKETNRQALLFWGALSLHAELFLRLPPVGRDPLAVEVGGEYHVSLDGQGAYTFQDPLSAAKLHSVFGTLGPEWLTRYLDAYLVTPKIPKLFGQVDAGQKTISEWIRQVSVRTLERAQRMARRRLWDLYGSPVQVSDARESVRLDFAQFSLAQGQPAAGQPGGPGGDALSIYEKGLAEQLAHLDQKPFIRPVLQVEDTAGRTAPASVEDLLDSQGINLLAGLPGSGKTTVQAWAIRTRRAEGRGLDVFLDLAAYARSGLPGLFEFAADRLRQDFELPVAFDPLRSALLELDRRGEIFWHIERWDALHPDERDRALASLSGLTRALVETGDPQALARRARERGLGFPEKIYHLLPWDPAQQAEYLALACDGQPDLDPAPAAALAQALPGLARLPGGLAYLLETSPASPVEALIGYLERRPRSLGEAPVRLRLSRAPGSPPADWGSPDVNAVFAAVSGLMQVGLAREFEPERLAQIDRVIVGACLPEKWESLEARMQRADAILEAGVRSGLLVRSGVARFAFAVPEIGYLMAALAVYGAGSPEWVQAQVQTYLVRHPSESAGAFLIDFPRWYARFKSVDNESNSPRLSSRSIQR